ncbi:MAG: cytosine deaminase [Leptolyngbyaceae bacterium]|nr:cytosine deaminase [Leptolyngbyaceae bacterium]
MLWTLHTMASPLLSTTHYWLHNAHVPTCFLPSEVMGLNSQPNAESLSLIDLEIQDGAIATIQSSVTRNTTQENSTVPAIDLRGGQVWPCFIDLHTHLDKGHIWNRTSNPDGTFDGALKAVQQDAQQYWLAEDIYRRMEFGLKCSYAHGTQAIRTHIDSSGDQAEISLTVFAALQKEWADKLILQAVSLVPLDYFLTPAAEVLADQIAEIKGVLGGVARMGPDLDAQLDRVFALAKERNLDLDFHTDESNNPEDITLRHVAAAALRHEFTGQIVCGHCCSLAVQSPEEAAITLDLVRQAGIGVVSLPMCNLYLQDRGQNRTPRWRGVTLLHELKQQGTPVAVANDNCRDPFHGFGDHDVWEVFALSARIAHLDRPYGDWPLAVTATPAQLMKLPGIGKLAPGTSADLVLFKARNFSELLARSQHDRTVLRQGIPIDTTLPDYAELDDLCGFFEATP